MKRNLSNRRGKFNKVLRGVLALLITLAFLGSGLQRSVTADRSRSSPRPNVVIPDGGNAVLLTRNVVGLPGTITSVSVKLVWSGAVRMADLDILLVHPNGVNNLEFISDSGGASCCGPFSGTLTYADSAVGCPQVNNTATVAGTYLPADYSAVEAQIDWPGVAGVPATINHAGTGGSTNCGGNGAFTFASAFNGLTPNGNWSLYIHDDTGSGDASETLTSWSLIVNGATAAESRVAGNVSDSNGGPVAGTVVNMNGTQSRKTITDNNGDYHFNSVETNGFYTVTPTRSNYAFSPGSRSFSQIGGSTDSAFTGVSGGDTANPIDTPEFFVRQQYLDVLGREPDEAGFNYWSDQILACAGDADCTRATRTGVASAFFVEQEFRQSGAFIYNLYKDALDRRPVYAEYSADRGQVVGGATLEAQKQAFAAAFVSRAEFASRYESNTTAESFVDALLANVQQASGVDLSSQRDSLIGRYHTGTNQADSRALVLRDVTESAAVRDANYNAAFVTVEYFGYLHRGPDQQGFDFWVNVLNESGRNGDPANYTGMVCSFITSREYQNRFSSVVSRSNSECGGQ